MIDPWRADKAKRLVVFLQRAPTRTTKVERQHSGSLATKLRYPPPHSRSTPGVAKSFASPQASVWPCRKCGAPNFFSLFHFLLINTYIVFPLVGNKEESCLKSGNLVNLGGDAKLLSTTVCRKTGRHFTKPWKLCKPLEIKHNYWMMAPVSYRYDLCNWFSSDLTVQYLESQYSGRESSSSSLPDDLPPLELGWAVSWEYSEGVARADGFLGTSAPRSPVSALPATGAKKNIEISCFQEKENYCLCKYNT